MACALKLPKDTNVRANRDLLEPIARSKKMNASQARVLKELHVLIRYRPGERVLNKLLDG